MQQLLLLECISSPPSASPAFAVSYLMNEKIPFHAVEALLEEYLIEELSEFELLDVKADTVSDVNCKWRYSSALQKSIRRGYAEDSVRYALTYHAADPSGFWTRLCLVAFEDIGVGDVWAVAMTLAIARSKSFRQKLGGEIKAIHYIITKLAAAVKDRTVCDFFQILENRSIIPSFLTTLKSASSQELSDIALSDQHQFDTRTSAAWMLWGTDKLKNIRLPLRAGERDLFEHTIERLRVPGLIKYVTLRGMIACRCAMNLSYPFVWIILNQSSTVKVIETELPERFYIKGLPEEAYDQHTREGKSSYRYFYQSCHAVNDFLTNRGIVEKDEIVSTIGISVFITESALLDRRIDFVGAEQIYQMTVEDDYRKSGLTLVEGLELSRVILENYKILRQSRQKVVAGK